MIAFNTTTKKAHQGPTGRRGQKVQNLTTTPESYPTRRAGARALSSPAIEIDRRRIAIARRLLKPTPVDRGEVPDWLIRRIEAAFGPGPYPKHHLPVVHAACQTTPDGRPEHWLDHHGETFDRGESCFVSEPYHVTERDHRSVARFCEVLGLEYEIQSNGWHFPGEVVRILIRESDPKVGGEVSPA